MIISHSSNRGNKKKLKMTQVKEMCVIYVLKLVEGKYYVGKSDEYKTRIKRHFSLRGGSVWTRKYKPLNVVETIFDCSEIDEKETTLKYMRKYGWENVRGYCWCQTILKKPPKCL